MIQGPARRVGVRYAVDFRLGRNAPPGREFRPVGPLSNRDDVGRADVDRVAVAAQQRGRHPRLGRRCRSRRPRSPSGPPRSSQPDPGGRVHRDRPPAAPAAAGSAPASTVNAARVPGRPARRGHPHQRQPGGPLRAPSGTPRRRGRCSAYPPSRRHRRDRRSVPPPRPPAWRGQSAATPPRGPPAPAAATRRAHRAEVDPGQRRPACARPRPARTCVGVTSCGTDHADLPDARAPRCRSTIQASNADHVTSTPTPTSPGQRGPQPALARPRA